MTRARFLVPAVALLVLGFVAGAWTTWTTSNRSGGAGTSSARAPLYWICPMHPAHKSDGPGTAPCCGMAFEPVYADGDGRPHIAGAIRLTPEARQLIGVRVGTAETGALSRTVRTVGRVVADENREYRVLAAGEGIVRRLPETTATGSLVRANDVLMTYFARDFVRPQQLYFATLDYLDAAVKGGAAADRLAQVRGQVRVAIDELINFGMSEPQIAELGRTRKLTSDIEVRSPASGYVVSRSVSPEQRFDRGTELFRIADIRRVWILVDTFEGDDVVPRPGTAVRVTLPHAPARAIEARVSAALPQFDADARTLKVRLEADNADLVLRPGMYVDAEIPVERPPGLTVPVEAIVDSGRRKTVFVDRGDGFFEPRAVRTGQRADGRVEIVSGLAPGERIALSGTFLLDSETRIKAAAAGIATPAKDLVCGMDVDEGKAARAGLTSTWQGETYFFCAAACKRSFDANPAAYVPAAEPHQHAAARHAAHRLPPATPAPAESLEAVLGPAGEHAGAARAPITNVPVQMQLGQYASLAESPNQKVMMDAACGTVVLRDEAERAGLSSVHDGVTYWFSSRRCKDLFDREPARYALDPADAKRTVAATYSASHAAGEKGAARHADDPKVSAGPKVIDPVCGMEVDANEAMVDGRKASHAGRTFYFCAHSCRELFEKEPAKYAAKPAAAR